MNKFIPLWSSFVPKDAIDEVRQVFESGWLNTGEKEKSFRETFKEKFGVPYCVATNNGTASLKIGLAAIGICPGDEVISTPYTFIATNTSILEMRAKPVFADIDYDTLNMDPNTIEELITDKTKAIICVHYGGNPCDMDKIRKIGKEHDIPIIEDAAHALGSKYKGHYIGSEGDIAAFSLQAIKVITCGDGGLVTTTKEKYYNELKKYVWYGIDRDSRDPESIDPLPERIDVLGFKANLNDVAAAIGLAGLRHIDEALARRREIGKIYREEFEVCEKLKSMHYDAANLPNFQLFPIHVKERDKFAAHMKAQNIKVGLNNRRNDRYSIFGGLRNLPMAGKADNDTIIIPIHMNLTDEDVQRVVRAVKEFDRK